jgi:hypothetical protein
MPKSATTLPSRVDPRRPRVALYAAAWNGAYRVCFRLGLNAQAAQFAARAFTAGLRKPDNGRQSVLISGLGRVGKTILARQLADRYGYYHLTTDHALDYFFAIADDAERLQFRERFYTSIIERWPNGLIIEGDDFILKNRVRYAKTDHEVDIGPAVTVSERFGIEVFLLGNADVSAEEKIRAFEAYSSKAECWTPELRDVRTYALWSIRVSTRLRSLADGDRIRYVEIDPKDFDASIAATAETIAARGLARGRSPGVTARGR